MAIDSYLYGNTANDEMIMSAVSSIVPNEEMFSTLSGNEPFSNQYKLYVPMRVKGDMSHILIELAFHYIAKVIVAAYCNDTNCDPFENSIAERSIKNLQPKIEKSYFQEVYERYEYATMQLQNYIDGEDNSTNNIIQHCFFLAKLDICYRKAAIPSDLSQFFTPATPDEVIEIKEMVLKFGKSFIPRVLRPESKIIFNPNFGFGECLIGETECDMIIDKTIIDLRTDIGTSYPRDRVTKSMVHFLLTEINRDFGNKENAFPIDNLVFYSARYGETEILSLEDIDQYDITKAVNKFTLATNAEHKFDQMIAKEKYKNTPRPNNINSQEQYYSHSQQSRNDDIDRQDYNDGYNQVVRKKKKHTFRKVLILIIVLSLLTIGFVYLKDYYVMNYGNDFAIESILHNLFGLDI
ncbi:hypothetical protein [Ruminococcus bovis]|uniref:Uncharacterized protein n=1 Tax=Ruminococcus bovis TaxID=2564099 RepID=A0A4P8XWJ2_9FIRM|nr:hypothetical protein [Ruminococcus bovis]QCT06350.1 hypothetical protein E5Z56_02855 [Ruminococcus bovis]